MAYSHEDLMAHLHELRKGGERALKSIEDEFNSIHQWCCVSLDFVRSKEFKQSCSASYPKTPKVARTKNNNDSSHVSLETSQSTLRARKLQMEEMEDIDLSKSSSATTSSSSNDVSLAGNSQDSFRMPTRFSQRIKEKSILDESTSSSTASNSSIIDGSVNKSKLKKPLTEQKTNSSSGSSSTNPESSGGVHPKAVLIKKSKPVQLKSASQQEGAHATIKGAGPASKKLARGTPITSGSVRPAPLSKKILDEAPTKSGPGPAPKKLLKGTPTMSGPGPAPKKLLKGTPTMSGPGPAPKKLLKGTPTKPGSELPPKKLLKGTPTMAGPLPKTKILSGGTPTSSGASLSSKLLFKDTAALKIKSAAHQNPEFLHGVPGGPVSKSHYVQQVAQTGFSHIGKLKALESSSNKPIPVKKDSRETFVIAPCALLGSSDLTQDSGKPQAQERCSNVGELGMKAEHDTTFVIGSSDVANSTFVLPSSDIILNSEKKVLRGLKYLPTDQDQEYGKSDVGHSLNTTFPVAKDPNATFDVASYDVTLDPEERTPLPSKNKDDYGLDDVRSDDSSDDESNPKKVVPEWAQAANRQLHLEMQYEVTCSQMFAFFESVETTPDLTKLFTDKIDRRILIRRSSAVWLPIKGN